MRVWYTFRWTCIYPIYIDAKRPYGTGERRIPRTKAVWWPLSKDIADATNRLGFGTLHEVQKAHPRDWENPGRVRVQWKKDGKLVNPTIQTSAFLYYFPVLHSKIPSVLMSSASLDDREATIRDDIVSNPAN
jgi:signal recognition particle subunit SEC65